MAQNTSSRTKSRVNVAAIGPAEHGKSMLVAAILKLQAKSNLAQAVSCDDIKNVVSAACEYETSSRHYTHVDCAGVDDYVKDLIIEIVGSITNNYRPQIFIHSADVLGTVSLPNGVQMVMPGDDITMTFALAEQMYFAIFENKTDEDDDARDDDWTSSRSLFTRRNQGLLSSAFRTLALAAPRGQGHEAQEQPHPRKPGGRAGTGHPARAA